MSEAETPHQAIGWIEIQVERLSELRNAGTRDPAFREWRQNTLTIVQRIWPDIANRSTRFRRIPFSPSSTRASDQEVRLAFDKGCGEARRMLKLWITELETNGFVGSTDGSKRSADEGPGNDSEIRAEAPLPPTSADAPRLSLVPPTGAGQKTTSKKSRSNLREMLGFVEGTGPRAAGNPEPASDNADLEDTPRAGAAMPSRPGAPPPRPVVPPARPTEPQERPPASAEPPPRNPAPPQLPEEFAPPDLKMEPLGYLSESEAPNRPRGRRPQSGSHGVPARVPLDAAPPIAAPRRPPAPDPVLPRPLDDTGAAGTLPVTHSDPRAPMEIEQLTPDPPRDAVDNESGRSGASSRANGLPPLSQSSPSIDSPPPTPSAPPVAASSEPIPPALDADVLAASIAEAVRRAVDELLPRGTAVSVPASAPAPAPSPRSAAPAVSETGLPIVRFASKNDPKAAPFTSAAARTMARLSREVTALGVPAGQRARVRAQLIDLARTLDRDKVDWQTLRDAMALSMDFPPLACRVIPVLVAFLEDAA